jgi:hypothetical protein
MDEQNLKDLAQKAWELYHLAQEIQKALLDAFFHEFLDLEKRQRIINQVNETTPF